MKFFYVVASFPREVLLFNGQFVSQARAELRTASQQQFKVCVAESESLRRCWHLLVWLMAAFIDYFSWLFANVAI